MRRSGSEQLRFQRSCIIHCSVVRCFVDSQEVAEGIVLDFDNQGRLIGIDIDYASQVVDLAKLEAQSLPLTNLAIATQF